MAKGLTALTIVVATEMEAEGLRRQLEKHPSDLAISFLVTGVSMVNASFALGRYLALHQPDFVIQYGIAGSFKHDLAPGVVVEVGEECFPEMGAESPAGWLSLADLGFSIHQEGNVLTAPIRYLPHLPNVRGITVNTVSGVQATIDQLRETWDPGIETMEGGAFFHAMKQTDIPFMQLRGISNMVEPRNRDNWRIGHALQAVQEEALRFILAFEKNND